MANISLTKENIKYIRDAFSHFFPEDTIYSADKPYVSGEFNWENRRYFIDFVYRLTGVQIKSEKDFQNIKKAELAVEGLVENEEKKPEANTQTKEQREQAERIRQEREASQKEAVEDAKQDIEASIKKQQELAEATKNSKVYVKVKLPKPADITEDQAKSIETLRTAAKINPQKLTKDIENTIEEKIKTNLPPEITEEEAQILYKQTAYRIVTNLQGNSLAKESLTKNAISRDKNVLSKIINNKDTLNAFKYSAAGISNPETLEYVLTRRVASAAFGESFVDNVFGPENLSDINVELSTTPREGFSSYDLAQIPNQYSGLLSNQNSFTGSLQSFGEGEIKSRLLSQVGGWLDTQIARLPADSFLSQTYNNELVQGALSYFGLGNPIAWEGTTFVGRIAIQNGLGPVLGWAQNLTGLNLGVSKAVSAIASEVVGNTVATTAATEVGAEIVAGTVGATAGAGAGVVIGQVVIPIPVVGAVIGAAVTWIGTKIAKLIPPGTLKKWSAAIIGGVAGLIALPFVGIGAALGIGLGTTVISAGLGGGLGGLTLGGIGTGIAGFFGALGGAFLGAVGMPILVTLLAFPVVVAFIMFMINSGAYVVPPTEGVFGNISSPYIGIVKTPEPTGPFSNNEFPKTITYKVIISAKMGILTNVSIKYDCIVVSNSAQTCPSISNIPTSVDSISPSNPYSFTYTSTYNQNYKNSAIIDTITVVANTMGQTGISADGSASVIFGAPPISCPLPSGKPINSDNYSYNSQSNTGHGSTTYWNAMGEPHYRYPLPQLTSCFHPSDCLYYGYALDVFPNGTTTVYAPTVLGKNIAWSLAGTFTNPGAGYSLTYTDTTGVYTMVLTHIFSPFAPTTVNSGAKITTLFNQGSNTHLHMEFQMNGRWVKPENYFCK